MGRCKKHTKKNIPTDGEVFDFVIIGSGAAGSIVAARLGEKGYKVLVLEQGPDNYDPNPPPNSNLNLINVPAFHPLSTVPFFPPGTSAFTPLQSPPLFLLVQLLKKTSFCFRCIEGSVPEEALKSMEWWTEEEATKCTTKWLKL